MAVYYNARTLASLNTMKTQFPSPRKPLARRGDENGTDVVPGR